MEAFAAAYGDWHPYFHSYTWKPLEMACRFFTIPHEEAHPAAEDARAPAQVMHALAEMAEQELPAGYHLPREVACAGGCGKTETVHYGDLGEGQDWYCGACGVQAGIYHYCPRCQGTPTLLYTPDVTEWCRSWSPHRPPGEAPIREAVVLQLTLFEGIPDSVLIASTHPLLPMEQAVLDAALARIPTWLRCGYEEVTDSRRRERPPAAEEPEASRADAPRKPAIAVLKEVGVDSRMLAIMQHAIGQDYYDNFFGRNGSDYLTGVRDGICGKCPQESRKSASKDGNMPRRLEIPCGIARKSPRYLVYFL
ncbi:MAG TPA: hypothetical protein VKT82_06195 [Ktedonobacterales bacterium]|nr:hypothetical protein [Ktedonobacterales bacterium]